MFFNLAEMGLHHLTDLLQILVRIGINLVGYLLQILLHIFQQTVGKMGEIDDVVHRIQDTVDQSLCQLTHSSRLLLSDQLLLSGIQLLQCLLEPLRLLRDLIPLCPDLARALLHDLLQPQRLLPQFIGTPLEEGGHQSDKEQEIAQQTVPLPIEGFLDDKGKTADRCLPAKRIHGLDVKDVGAIQEIRVFLFMPLLPRTPVRLIPLQIIGITGRFDHRTGWKR